MAPDLIRFVTEYFDEHTELHWFVCRRCGHLGEPFFNRINMRQEAREHARLCAASNNPDRRTSEYRTS